MSLSEMRDRIAASPPSGALRVFGDWFGRPVDNVHIAVAVRVEGDNLVIEFDEDEVLTIVNPTGLVLDDATFRIERADRVCWEWYLYGELKDLAHRYRIEHWLEDGEVRASSNEDRYQPTFSPSLAHPAVELL